jgi:hypothetical protein
MFLFHKFTSVLGSECMFNVVAASGSYANAPTQRIVFKNPDTPHIHLQSTASIILLLTEEYQTTWD